MEEVELKLLVCAEADRIGASDVLPGKGRAVQQRSIYFDTSEGDLAAAGVSLRIRRTGKRRTQTVKSSASSSAGLFTRTEWERTVEDDVPVVSEDISVSPLAGMTADRLVQVFEVDVTRRTWDVSDGDTVIEVVLDQGEIRATDRRTPVCELELELKSGPVGPLFGLARKLDGVAPLRLAALAKSERGYRLTKALQPAVKAGRVPLSRDMSAEQAFRAIMQACLIQFRLNEDLLLDSRAPEPLHQARVALRRMRSAFSIFRPLLGADAARDLRDRLGQLAKALGQARDLDVLMQRAGAGPLRNRIASEREAAHDRVAEVLGAAQTRALMLDLVEWLHCGSWLTDPDTRDARSQPARAFAARALNRFRRKVKKEGRHLAELDDEARHELRKDTKKLRYAAGFFEPLFDGKKERRRQKAFINILEDVQDELGALNDLATAPHVLDALGLDDEPAAAALVAGGNRKALLAAAEDAHGNLIDARRYWR